MTKHVALHQSIEIGNGSDLDRSRHLCRMLLKFLLAPVLQGWVPPPASTPTFQPASRRSRLGFAFAPNGSKIQAMPPRHPTNEGSSAKCRECKDGPMKRAATPAEKHMGARGNAALNLPTMCQFLLTKSPAQTLARTLI